MPRISQRIVTLAIVCLQPAVPAALAQVAPLPAPVSNNAVAVVKSGKHESIYSFMGIGAKRTWDSITNAAYAMDTSTGKWTELRPVPGPAGRIGASAIGARGQILLLGGYTVDGQGGEITVSDFFGLRAGGGANGFAAPICPWPFTIRWLAFTAVAIST
jgi:hypothetical protein